MFISKNPAGDSMFILSSVKIQYNYYSGGTERYVSCTRCKIYLERKNTIGFSLYITVKRIFLSVN